MESGNSDTEDALEFEAGRRLTMYADPSRLEEYIKGTARKYTRFGGDFSNGARRQAGSLFCTIPQVASNAFSASATTRSVSS